jgi:hypothetical protein
VPDVKYVETPATEKALGMGFAIEAIVIRIACKMYYSLSP